MAILVRPGDRHRVTIIHDHPDGTRDVYTTDRVGVFDARVHQGSVDMGDEFFPGLFSTEFQISGGKFNHTRTKREIMKKKVRLLTSGDETVKWGKIKYVGEAVKVDVTSTPVVPICFYDHDKLQVFKADEELEIMPTSTLEDSRGYSRTLDVEESVAKDELYLRINDQFGDPTGIYVKREALRFAIDNPKRLK